MMKRYQSDIINGCKQISNNQKQISLMCTDMYGYTLPSPTQEACLYFPTIIKLVCVCVWMYINIHMDIKVDNM
jgi:hypothetical protein